jgi:multidrug efflux pump subunit AcrB
MPEARRFSASEFGQLWRDRIGQPAKLTQLAVDFLQGPGNGRDLTLELAHLDPLVSREAADELVRELAQIPGVGQISYSGNASRSEVSFELMPNGRALGFDESQISSRLRAQLDGLEATRLTRGSDEVRVMVRGETKDRRVLPDFSGLILTSSEGRQVALGEITKIQWQKGEVELRRINGQRVQRIEASIDQRINSKGLVEDLVSEEVLPKLEAHFPGLTTWDEAIDTDEDSDTAQALLIATLAVLATIFVLIGGYVRSLRLSAILLSAVPLSVSGALLGHVLLGLELSAATFLGILALGGLVINSGLLLHLRYTEALNSGSAVNTAMITSIRDRFRPIVLSSATTLIGLAPLIFNPSVQAAPLRPVAVSIGFGMLFSIPVILIILPCIIAALDSRQHQPRTIPIDSLHDGATTT